MYPVLRFLSLAKPDPAPQDRDLNLCGFCRTCPYEFDILFDDPVGK